MRWIIDKLQKYYLKKLGIKINFPSHINGKLVCETPSSLSNGMAVGHNEIGAYSYIGRNSQIRYTQIGRFCSIGSNVTIGAVEHPQDWLSTHIFAFNSYGPFKGDKRFTKIVAPNTYKNNGKSVIINNDVWIGDGAFIKSGVSIGNGAIIAAHAVVTKDVPEFAIVAGVPATIIRYRYSEKIIEKINQIMWWKYDLSGITSRIDFHDIDKAIQQMQKHIQNKHILPYSSSKITIESKKFYTKISTL